MLLVASLVMLVFLGAMGGVLDLAFRRSAEEGVSARLLLQIYGMLAATEQDEKELFLPDVMQEPGFNRLGTGLYGVVMDAQGRELWRSPSALDLNLPPQSKVGLYSNLNAGVPLFGKVRDARDEQLFFLSYRVLWQGAEAVATPYIFAVLQTPDTYFGEVQAFRNNLWGWLTGVAVLMIVVQAAVMSWGLAPLRRLALDLKQIEDGERDYLEGEYPPEIEGVTRNLNLLLSTERQQREKYRTTLADLAHSLKTPLAILKGASSALEYIGSGGESDLKETRATMDEQVARMNEIVGYQLERAVTTPSSLIRKPIEIAPLAIRLIQAMEKVYRDKGITIELDVDEAHFFGDERDLMELLGNIVDNACKYGRRKVRVEIRGAEERAAISIVVEDDGDGINKSDRHRVLSRGTRLDSRQAGQGIGLAVVVEIVARYGGDILISESSLGGAKLIVTLP